MRFLSYHSAKERKMENKKRQMKREKAAAESIAFNFAAGRNAFIRSVDSWPVDSLNNAFIVEAPQRKKGSLVTEG